MNLLSMPFSPSVMRLQHMRMIQEARQKTEVLIVHDNFLRGKIQQTISFKRMKQACLLARFYWIRYRYEDIDKEFREYCGETGDDSPFPTFNHCDTIFMDKLNSVHSLNYTTDFADIGVGLGLELENLNSFLAKSTQESALNKSLLKKSKSSTKEMKFTKAKAVPMINPGDLSEPELWFEHEQQVVFVPVQPSDLIEEEEEVKPKKAKTTRKARSSSTTKPTEAKKKTTRKRGKKNETAEVQS